VAQRRRHLTRAEAHSPTTTVARIASRITLTRDQGRCAVEPTQGQEAQATLIAFWSS
jgi:hypothetical protein